MDSFFIFDGKNSLDYGIRIESYPDRPYPERSYNSYTVPGRSGSLIYDTGAYANVTQSYDCYYKTIATAYEMQRYLTDWLLMPTGYRELEDSYSPDVYRKAIFAGPTDVSTFFGKFGKCTLDFNCLPHRFLKSGRIPISVTAKTTLINDGEEALPLIRVSGSGSGTVSIGSSVVTLSDVPEGLTIDSETQNVYAGAANKNSLATIGGGFPKLGKGHTGIEFSGGVTALTITPRWWIL